MTENAYQATSDVLESPRRPGSVGIPSGAIGVKTKDDDGQDSETRTVGEVCIWVPR